MDEERPCVYLIREDDGETQEVMGAFSTREQGWEAYLSIKDANEALRGNQPGLTSRLQLISVSLGDIDDLEITIIAGDLF